MGRNHGPPVPQQVVGQGGLQAQPFRDGGKGPENGGQRRRAPAGAAQVEQIPVLQLTVQVVEGRPDLRVDGLVVELMRRGPARHLGIEILEGLVQLVTGVLGPVRPKAGYPGILFQQVAHVRGDVGADRRAGQASRVGHALGELPVRPPRPVLVQESWRGRAAQLQVDLEAPVQGGVDETADQFAVRVRQVVGLARLVRRIGIVRGSGVVARRAADPERTPSPEGSIEAPGTAAGVAGRLEGTHPFL